MGDNLKTTDYLMFETISRDGLCDAESIGDCVDPKWRTKREDNDFKVDPRPSFQCETQPKILGNWTNDGVCEPINSSSKCGEEDQGNQMQKRDCEPGDIDICNNDTDIHRSIPCMFPCPTEAQVPTKPDEPDNTNDDGNGATVPANGKTSPKEDPES